MIDFFKKIEISGRLEGKKIIREIEMSEYNRRYKKNNSI